ncbi:MAG TPA: hypothetical protein VFZ99_05125 [Terriglobales bacterium]
MSWVNAVSGKTFATLNPANGEKLVEVAAREMVGNPHLVCALIADYFQIETFLNLFTYVIGEGAATVARCPSEKQQRQIAAWPKGGPFSAHKQAVKV